MIPILLYHIFFEKSIKKLLKICLVFILKHDIIKWGQLKKKKKKKRSIPPILYHTKNQ